MATPEIKTAEVRHHQYESFCEHCGCPIYVNDRLFMVDDNFPACSLTCAEELAEDYVT